MHNLPFRAMIDLAQQNLRRTLEGYNYALCIIEEAICASKS
jgi:hypothetical protein